MFKEQMLKTATDDIDNYYNSFIDGEYEKIYKIVANNGGDAEVTKKLLEKVGSKTLEKKG
ncbi:hypothetical protein IJU97_05610 [bacterium]|nr:hypothetical protein [bacterium]